ncbi:hypothetical protein T484DRAFT_2839084 [Baffinella frigidus]|nr:hypothetical protein T484DRAFT_2839084 [Cryptophyta sp. CCMP2293]
MQRVYPSLKQWCQDQFATEFQVVDMRWGVRDELTDRHETVELCSAEIRRCCLLSASVSFVSFYSDKYGYRPPPRTVPLEVNPTPYTPHPTL